MASLYGLYLKARLRLRDARWLVKQVEEERASMQELPERDDERFVNWIPIIVPLLALLVLALVFLIDFF